MFYKLFIIGLGLLLTNCGPSKKNTNECCLFHDDGRAKPIVSILPVIDSTFYDISWSLSDEISSLISKKVTDKGYIFLSQNTDIIPSDKNPFAIDMLWTKKMYPNTEFLVFIELVKHEDVPIAKKNKKVPQIRQNACNLKMSARLKIVDIRRETPKVVLQEKIKDSFFMPNFLDKCNYKVITWGTKEYKKSQMGEAHLQFSKKLAKRIQSYVILAKSR